MASPRALRLALLAWALAVPAAADVRYVPVVAQVPGYDGSYWNTEVWVTNLGDTFGTFAITFLPANEDNRHLLSARIDGVTVGPGETISLRDVVPPGRSGALKVEVSDNIEVRCRLYNASGRAPVGEMIPALRAEDLVSAGSVGFLGPLVRGPQFRTNLGLFNPGAEPLTVQVRLLNPEGETASEVVYSLPPGAQTQINDVLLHLGVERADGYQALLEAHSPFAAYAAIVDTRSGAPTLILPVVR